jgi:uncharacterized protein
MDDMLLAIKDKVKVVLLPRGKDQAKHYEELQFNGITVLNDPLSLTEIAANCRLFIGAGGTMTREMAVLGIPTISVYQDELLEVDEYLIKTGMMIHKPDLDGDFTMEFLKKSGNKPPNDELLKKGETTYHLIKKAILTKLESLTNYRNND